MVEITKGNFLGAAGPAGGPAPAIVGNPQAVDNAEILNQGLKSIETVALQIKETSDEMALQSALTEAQFTFGQQASDRANQVYLEDGTPGFKTMDADFSRLATETKNRVMERVPANKRDKFNLIFDDFSTKKRLAAQGVARNQQIDIATGEFTESYQTLKVAASQRDNRDNIVDLTAQADALVDSAVRDNLIDPKVGLSLKRTFRSDVSTAVIKQSIEENPHLALVQLSESSAAELGVDETRRQELITRAKSASKAVRDAQQTASVQQLNATKNRITTLGNIEENMIDNTPVASQPDGYKYSNFQVFEDKVRAAAQLHTPEEINEMRAIDPIRAAQMVMEQNNSDFAANQSVAKVKKKYDERNIEERKRQDAYRLTVHRKNSGLPVSDKEAQDAYTMDTAGADNTTKRKYAEFWGVPQPQLAAEISTAVATGNEAALRDQVDEEGNVHEGLLSTFSTLMRTNPKVLSGMTKDQINAAISFKKQLENGVPPETISKRVQEELLAEDSPTRIANRKTYTSSSKEGKSVRATAMTNLVREMTSIFGVAVDEEEMSDTLRNEGELLLQEGYEIHGNFDDATTYAMSQMQNSGTTVFPVTDSDNFFAISDNLMMNTPEKVFNAQNKEQAELLSRFFQNEARNIAGAAGHTDGAIRIAEDNLTAEQKSWRVFVKTDNGTEVELPRWKLPTKEQLSKFASIEANINQVNNWDNPEFRERQLTKGRRNVVDAIKSVPDAIEKGRKFVGKTLENYVKDISGINKDLVEEGKSKTPGTPKMSEMGHAGSDSPMSPSSGLWAVPFVGVLKDVHDMVVGEAGASEFNMEATAEVFGKMALDSPTQADEIIDNWMGEGDETVDADDIDAFNTTGKSPEDIANENFKQSLMDDNRQFLPDRPESQGVSQDLFNQLELAHELLVDPANVLKHSTIMSYLNSVPEENKTTEEKQYEENSALAEEKFGISVTPRHPAANVSDSKKIAANPVHSVLAKTLIVSEGYRSVLYKDTAKQPNRTIGIGWNIEPGKNDKANEEIVRWLNATNAGGRGKQYSLKELQAGRQTITRPDAIKVMNRFIESAERDAISIFGQSTYRNMSQASKEVVLDMLFQLGKGKKKTAKSAGEGFLNFSETIKKFRKNDPIATAHEIIDSESFKKQTPIRFAKHWAKLVKSGNKVGKEKLREAVDAAKKFAAKHMTKRSTLKPNDPNFIDIPKVVNRIFESVL